MDDNTPGWILFLYIFVIYWQHRQHSPESRICRSTQCTLGSRIWKKGRIRKVVCIALTALTFFTVYKRMRSADVNNYLTGAQSACSMK